MNVHRSLRFLASVAAVVALAGCASEEGSDATAGDEDDLTSLTARQRALMFEGVVYVDKDTPDAKVLETVHAQTKSAFGALLHSEVAAQTREFQNVDPASFKKRKVLVVDAAVPNDAGREMLEVRYTYKDNAVVPVKMARKTALSLALLGQGHVPKTKAIVEACTKNDKEARDDADSGLLWYGFDPQRASCRRAMEREQQTIDRETGALADPRTMIPASRANRVLLPVTMQLSRADNATRATYPEYDRLFAGASEPGVLTLVLLSGRLSHKRVEARKDSGYYEWLAALDVIFAENPDFELKKIEPNENLSTISAEGKRYTNLGFKDFIQWTVYGRGWPQGMPPSSRDNIAKTVADKLDMHWVTFEKKVKVSIGGAEAKDLTIRIETLFGAEEDATPHRRGLKNGDVFIYNGHSYIGEGPLDPAHFKPESFSRGYQLLWFDSCVSYNYYEKDFFTLKQGGSRELDLVTNGLEAPEYLSGEAQGYFVNKLIGGSMPSYQTLLAAAKATDALRVVDGEIDNRFDPNRTPIRIQR
ncbi:MAG: hypothetical protein KF764_26235 [Labilithrix sp.]|nr:hypothetical protein [Labilithrix sp.]